MRREHRIIDAAGNRAREGLRTLEDVLRFSLDHGALLRRAKELRHQLRGAFERFPEGVLEAHRDAAHDTGQHSSTPQESHRGDVRAVAVAAGKRVVEALRTLEEVGKILDAEFARRVASMRYLMYDLERDAILALGCGGRFQPRVCVLLTESLCRLPWMDVLRGAIDGGADMVQVREKRMSDRDLILRVGQILEIARPTNTRVVVNDRVDIALACGAHGVHLGTGDMSIRQARALAGTALLIGSSTHNAAEALAAVTEGADVCGVGAIFATGLKPEREPGGVDLVADFIRHYPNTPHLAIGGIATDNVAQLAAVGCRGVAVSGAVCGSDDPRLVVERLCKALAPRPMEPVE